MRGSRRMALHSAGAGGGTSFEASYTGNWTDTTIFDADGTEYRLLTLTSSGTLTLDTEIEAEIWLCDGGMKGGRVKSSKVNGTNGGMGGKFLPAQKITLPAGTTSVTIGAGNSGVTKFGTYMATFNGSGGGRGYLN